MNSDSTLLSKYGDSSAECDSRQPVNDANLNGEVRTICIGIQSSAIRPNPINDGIQPSSLRIYPRNNAVNLQLSDDEDNILTGSNETVCNEDIQEVINARVVSVSDGEDQRRKESRAVLEVREYLFQQEVATIDATIITPQQVPQIMIHSRNKRFWYAASITLLCAMGIIIFVSHHGTQNSLTAIRDSRDTSSSHPSKYLSFTPSIRRNTKYHDFFDTFKKITPEDILSNISSPQHRALLWLANDDNRTMFNFDPKLLERYALVTLFFATGGGEGSWHSNYNFLSDEDVCAWMDKPVFSYEDLRSSMMGASCYYTEGRSVTELALASNNLIGTIPEE